MGSFTTNNSIITTTHDVGRATNSCAVSRAEFSDSLTSNPGATDSRIYTIHTSKWGRQRSELMLLHRKKTVIDQQFLIRKIFLIMMLKT